MGRTEPEFWVGSGAGRSRSRADSSQLGGAGRRVFITRPAPARTSPSNPPAPRPPRPPRETRAAAPGEPGVSGARAQPGLGPERTRPDSPAPQAPLPAPLGQAGPRPLLVAWIKGHSRPGPARPREPGPGSRAPSSTGPPRGARRGLCRPGPPRGRRVLSGPTSLRRDGPGRQGCVCGHPHLGWHEVTPGLKSRSAVSPTLVPRAQQGSRTPARATQSSFVQILGRGHFLRLVFPR